MLWHKAQGAGGFETPIVGLVGYSITVVTSSTSTVNVDLSGIDIRAGDLGVMFAGFHSGATNAISGDWTTDYEGVRFESAHRTFSGGETTASVTTSTNVDVGHAVVFVYRGYTFTSWDVAVVGGTGMPNPPPEPVSTSDKVLIGGAMDDDIITMTAPSGYTLIEAGNAGVSETGSSWGYAEKDIVSSGTEDPGTFGGGGDDTNIGFTYVLSPT